MKRYTVLNSILFLWIIIFEFEFKSQGYFLSIFARQDALHYLFFGPLIFGFTAFAIAYQLIGIKWKDLKHNWQNLIAIVLTPLLGVTAFFTTEFYMRLITSFQLVVILSFVSIILFTTLWNLSRYFLDKKVVNKQ